MNDSEEESYEQTEILIEENHKNYAKLIACCIHTLQLALKVLNQNVKFKENIDGVLTILRRIKAKPTASNEF